MMSTNERLAITVLEKINLYFMHVNLNIDENYVKFQK